MFAQPGSRPIENPPAARSAAGLPEALAPASPTVERLPSPRLFQSSLLVELAVRHGFTTRVGGVSSGRYQSLNLGEKWGDQPAAVAQNLALVASDAGFAPEALCQVVQVHGTSVLTLEQVERRQREADGMATAAPLVLGVYSADCVGVLLADGHGRVAAVHAGWRGSVAGIAEQAVAALVALGAQRRELRAALGPSIGPCCFEVREDVAAPFRQLSASTVSQRSDKSGEMHTFVNLRAANRVFLEAAGLLPAHIDDAPPCSHCEPQRFFSFRRDGAAIGQQLAFIVGGCS